MKTPPYEDARKCLEFRKASKLGYNQVGGTEFCEKMLKKYPEWYASTQAQVFEETLPFGAKQRKDLPSKGSSHD